MNKYEAYMKKNPPLYIMKEGDIVCANCANHWSVGEHASWISMRMGPGVSFALDSNGHLSRRNTSQRDCGHE